MVNNFRPPRSSGRKRKRKRRLQLELKDARSKFESRLSESSKDTTALEIEVQTLRDAEGKLKAELGQKKSEIDRYKCELSVSMEQQSDLERAKAQLDLDWTHRYDDMERQQYERSEELVKGLTRAQEEAQAELTEKDRELEHYEVLVKTLTADRIQTLTALRRHGITLQHSLRDDEPASDGTRVSELLVQNESLRAVVRQMRKEMETLGEEIPAKSHPMTDRRDANLIANEYVKNLEKDVQELKAKLRKMEHEAKDPRSMVNPEAGPGGAVLTEVGDNLVIRTHVDALNNTIGSLRSEKTELVAQLRKQQTCIAHLEAGLSQLYKQPLQKQATIEQLQYELSSQQRRHHVEVAGLKVRVADLDLQLAETRKEADDYYKASIERNLETTALGNEISKMKMVPAEKRPAVNYGAQELVIQQLQDEIERMRRGHGGGPEPHNGNVKGPARWADPTAGDHGLREKLKQATRHISQLAREKKQLIEMGNRLRARMYKAGLQAGDQVELSYPPVGPLTFVPAGPHAHPADYLVTITGSSGIQAGTSSENFYTTTGETGTSAMHSHVGLSEKMKNKLIELERLQYELTKKKLASEQRDEFLSTGEVDALSALSWSVSLGPLGLSDENGEMRMADEDEYRPAFILKKSACDPSVKLSPVPEDTVPKPRPQSAPGDVPRPTSALSDSFRPTTSQSGRAGVGMLSMSSVGGESLTEVWKLLDEEVLSPRPFTPLHSAEGPFRGLQYSGDAYDRLGSSQSFTLRGSQSLLQPKPRPQPKHSAHRKPAVKKAEAKVRNYNLKDT